MGTQSFAFGENWEFIVKKYLNQDRINEAKKSLSEFMEIDSLHGKTFIDIGCGSGLFSLAAFQLGASSILSLDIDKKSVECCQLLKKENNDPDNWQIMHGSMSVNPEHTEQ